MQGSKQSKSRAKSFAFEDSPCSYFRSEELHIICLRGPSASAPFLRRAMLQLYRDSIKLLVGTTPSLPFGQPVPYRGGTRVRRQIGIWRCTAFCRARPLDVPLAGTVLRKQLPNGASGRGPDRPLLPFGQFTFPRPTVWAFSQQRSCGVQPCHKNPHAYDNR